MLTRIAVVLVCIGALAGCTTRTGQNLDSSNNWTTQEKNDDLLVGFTLQPATADHNALFIELKNTKGEPIEGAKVKASSLKQFLFSTDKNLSSTYVAIGTYRINTDMGAGNSEMNISVTLPGGLQRNFRIEANVPYPTQ